MLFCFLWSLGFFFVFSFLFSSFTCFSFLISLVRLSSFPFLLLLLFFYVIFIFLRFLFLSYNTKKIPNVRCEKTSNEGEKFSLLVEDEILVLIRLTNIFLRWGNAFINRSKSDFEKNIKKKESRKMEKTQQKKNKNK